MEVKPATPDDAPAITALQQRCFTGAFFERIWPLDPAGPGVPYLCEEWARNIASPVGKQPSRAAVVRKDGAITSGILLWIVRNGDMRHYNDRWAPLRPGMDTDAWEQFMGPMHKQHTVVMGDADHVFVEILMTDAEVRKQGQASALLQWTCDLADEMGVPIYLDAAKDAVSLYRKFGFVEQELGWESHAAAMKRPAKK